MILKQLILSFANVLSIAIVLYDKILIASIIFSWLEAFNILNFSNRLVYQISKVLHVLTNKYFSWFRRFLPPINGLDFSPILGFLALSFVGNFLLRVLYEFANFL
ncbi:MAG: YggT family protein [Alphaproteobacteria bacterium]|nr:YggT family protein [Alphaproteobacteria bacterium]